MQLVLVRHALPERVDGAAGGVADPRLTALGQQQAHRVVDAVGGGVQALYSSPMARARATAAPLAAATGVEPVVVDDLREYDAESPHYVPVHEMPVVDPAGWQRIVDGLLPEGVDVAGFTARVAAALEGIVAAHPGRGAVVVVAHAGVINCWLAHLLGIDRPLAFPLDYTGISRVLATRDGRRLVRTVNEIAHVSDLLGPTAGTSAG
ncbi:histidine phosphatase family protein [Pseudonocardia hydrocarbonoxydans]|uniref:Phosphoglycerate mutase n=1 Tax=Pseudonocardia hydrocarbonoxydans TaxID=76726 RepID=A0A4Y3WI82_9PSEU|nr:histidine phosphatase family protein [Pseudonocardia hydrocarbonoxydans]GEC18494.1 phosphoglycerate mutase [Pseudonocardia hydrocarbonoxydans]